MIVDIPNQKMKKKLEHLLSGVPGKFEHRPRIVGGFDQLVVFKEKGIPCPDFTIHLEEARKWLESGEVFGRNKVHEKGHDIVGHHSPEWTGREFWSKVIPNKKEEYRIHIFAGEDIQQAVKVFDPKAVRKRNDDLPIQNTETGWKYNHSFKRSDNAINLAKHAVEVLGYLWGAVDLLEDLDGYCYVLEVNTAPGMDDTTARAYANAIQKYVRHQHPS